MQLTNKTMLLIQHKDTPSKTKEEKKKLHEEERKQKQD